MERVIHHNGGATRSGRTAGTLSRRCFLAAGSTSLAAGAAGTAPMNSADAAPKASPAPVTFGLVTDLHYADKESWNTRCYRDSAKKLREAVGVFNDRRADFIVELGDIVDKADRETEFGYLETINGVYAGFRGSRHFVIGNHDVATFSKTEFIRAAGARKNYYSFDFYSTHFVVLDANYRGDGVPYNAGNFDWTDTIIPDSERAWLEHDLEASDAVRTIVFIHQNLHDETDPHGVKNAPVIRGILESAGTVAAVFQGHMHSGGYAEINGIRYITLRAAVEGCGIESNAFAVAAIDRDGLLTVEGFGNQETYGA